MPQPRELASSLSAASPRLTGSIAPHYDLGMEAARLGRHAGPLEQLRTQEIILRYATAPPARVLDVGGGPGAYAHWLATLGYDVHLLDLVPLHVEQARAAAAPPRAIADDPSAAPLFQADLGDARDLSRFADASFDLVLMLGPLYHLQERSDRLRAWREAARVLRSGGIVIAAAISRFASALDGLCRNLIDDPAFMEIVRGDLRDGRHHNPTNHPAYFTTAYFHHPDELAQEIAAAGGGGDAGSGRGERLEHVETVAVEGPAWMLPDFEARWSDPARRARMLEIIRATEREPALLGASAHLLAVARKLRAG